MGRPRGAGGVEAMNPWWIVLVVSLVVMVVCGWIFVTTMLKMFR